MKSTLKSEYAKQLIESGIKPYSVVRHSYTNNRLSGKTNLDRVQSVDVGLSPTLDTRCDCLAVVVEANMKEKAFTDIEKQLFIEDGNIKRYLGGDKIDEFKEGQMATTTYPNGYGHGPRTHDESIALNTIDRPCVKNNLRIRKLTPNECIKLMGFESKDTQAMRDIGMSDAQIYHCAGDSIVSLCLVGLIGMATDIQEQDLYKLMEDYVETLKEN